MELAATRVMHDAWKNASAGRQAAVNAPQFTVGCSGPVLIARALLGNAFGFDGCLPRTLDTLVSCGRVRRLGKGELLASDKQPFDMLCLVIDGWIESSSTDVDGRRLVGGYHQAGDVLGIMCLIDGRDDVVDSRARSEATVLLIPGAAVRRLHAEDPALMRAFALQLTARKRLLYERLACDPALPCSTRVARLLQLLAKLYGVRRDGETLINARTSQSDLADWLGASRQSVNATVQRFKEEGLIRMGYSTISIVDPAGLAALARR